jgi:hypothetical protein
MPMLKFTLRHGEPIWINPDTVIAVQRSAYRSGPGPGSRRPGASIPTGRGLTDADLGTPARPTDPDPDLRWGANIHIDIDSHWSVQESVEDVVAKIDQARER